MLHPRLSSELAVKMQCTRGEQKDVNYCSLTLNIEHLMCRIGKEEALKCGRQSAWVRP